MNVDNRGDFSMGPTSYRVNSFSDLWYRRKRLYDRGDGFCTGVTTFTLTVLFLLTVTTVAWGKTFRVNSGFDVSDLNPGNELCVAYLIVSPPFVLPFCTLRAAIEESNNLPGDDLIELQPSIMSLTIEGRNENDAKSGDLDIIETLTIKGRGPDQTVIDGRRIDRLFDIIAGNVTLILKDMTLINGEVSSGGGAVYNRGRLILDHVVMSGHRAVNSTGGILHNDGRCTIAKSHLEKGRAAEGGALYNGEGARLTLASSTVSASHAAIGAGISNHSVMTAVNTTISGNGSAATLHGGGINNAGTQQLTHSTVYGNAAQRGGGINDLGFVSLRNCIVAGNRGGDCSPRKGIDEDAYVLDTDGSCAAGGMGITVADPGLKALKNNSGPTPTHSLVPSSPARDSGMLFDTSPVDQRGVRRPQGKSVDRGAVEAEVFTPLPMIYPLLSKKQASP